MTTDPKALGALLAGSNAEARAKAGRPLNKPAPDDDKKGSADDD